MTNDGKKKKKEDRPNDNDNGITKIHLYLVCFSLLHFTYEKHPVQAAATVLLLPEALRLAFGGGVLDFLNICEYFSFSTSIFICFSRHSKLQKAASPL